MRALVAFVGIFAFAAIAHGGPQRAHDLPGWPRYEQLCAACHGTDGDGRGAAAAYSRGEPRDFTRGAFEWRTTPFGAPPTDDDLARTIRFGARGTSMPGFGDVLADRDIAEMIAIVRAFGPNVGPPQRAISLGAEPAATTSTSTDVWQRAGCASCHGADGRGNRALAEPPYDLTAEPLRRPRDGDTRRAAAWSIATGMTGTAMPGFARQLPTAEIWALADHVVELNAHAIEDRMAMRGTKLAVGTWPGADPDEAMIFGSAIAPQGSPPTSLAPAEASLSARRCARCHAKQAREWQPSLHAGAMSIGYRARLADGVDATNCAHCHAPLAEQKTDDALASESVQCAGCHVRNWVRRGPQNVAPSLATLPNYPFTPSPLYERSDFCMTCHQLSNAVAGKPLLNTYKEWLEGPYMPRGIQCQSCHMPNREHQWLGVHDRDTLRQAYRLDVRAHRDGDSIEVDADFANIGAGHDLPTTATPAIYVVVELVDNNARVIGHYAQRIGRDVYWDGSWHERADTRIAPGESLHVARVWRGARATAARVTIEVHPDEYYEGLYAQRLAANPLYAAALQKARGSHYIAETREIALP